MRKYILLLLTCALSLPLTVSAQLSVGGTPLSFQRTVKSNVPTVSTGIVDAAKLLAEDTEDEKLGVPMRFGFPFDVNYTLLNSGIWETLADGSKTWRLRIKSDGAFSINLLYDNFWLAEGARFYIYNEDRTMLIGGFTTQNNKEHGKFATAPVQGDAVILELNVPADVNYPGEISISRIVHAYRDMFNKDTKDYGSSGSCNNNVNCPEGDPWEDQVNSVAMIILGSGFRWCSGAMINNVRQDLTPYFLTADHCLNNPETFIIMFNYQSPGCTNQNGPTNMSLQGTTLLANNATSDFALLLLDEAPPDSFNVFYSGWSNINSASPTTVGIHHPAGDIKKISFNDNPVTSTSYLSSSPGNNSHWRVDNWEDGTTEGGSSGSPLFDNNQRIVGQLHGGYASCASITDDWYGKLSVSWNGSSSSNRLRDWLDPDNTAATTLDGIDGTGLTFEADTTIGWVPFDVQFTATSKIPVDSWNWDFGDDNESVLQNPAHTYITSGAFDVRLDITSGSDQLFKLKTNYIIALADTLSESSVVSAPGSQVEIDINVLNSVPIDKIILPIEYGGPIDLSFDSMSTVGCRTDYFEINDMQHFDPFNDRLTIRLQTSYGNALPELPAGRGSIIKLYFTIGNSAQPDDSTTIHLDGYNSYQTTFTGSIAEYQPHIIPGTVSIPASCCVGIRGNIDGDAFESIDIADLVYFIDYSFGNPPGPEPVCMDESDVDNSSTIDIADIVYLVDYMFATPSGPQPAGCF